MTATTMDLRELLEKTADTDFLREMIGFTAQRLMELEVETLTGAPHGSRLDRGRAALAGSGNLGHLASWRQDQGAFEGLDDFLVAGGLDGVANVALELFLACLTLVGPQDPGSGPALLGYPGMDRTAAEAVFGRQVALADRCHLVFPPRGDHLVIRKTPLECHTCRIPKTA